VAVANTSKKTEQLDLNILLENAFFAGSMVAKKKAVSKSSS
jgi:hypothetical protein